MFYMLTIMNLVTVQTFKFTDDKLNVAGICSCDSYA